MFDPGQDLAVLLAGRKFALISVMDGWKLAVWGAYQNDVIAARSGSGPAYALRLSLQRQVTPRGRCMEIATKLTGRP
ncbi:hypothetical protein ABIA19_006051 [Sinorhizobium fredii]